MSAKSAEPTFVVPTELLSVLAKNVVRPIKGLRGELSSEFNWDRSHRIAERRILSLSATDPLIG